MQRWSVNEQTKDALKRLTLEHIDDDALESFTGVVQSVITRTVTQASTSNHHTAISSTESLDVFVRSPDGIEHLCRPTDRVLVSVGHKVSVVNVKTKEGPRLLYLANHTTRHEYRPQYKGASILAWIAAAIAIVGLPTWIAGEFLLPRAWVNALTHSQLGNNVLLVVGGLLVFAITKFCVQSDKENCKRVETVVRDLSLQAKQREQVQWRDGRPPWDGCPLL